MAWVVGIGIGLFLLFKFPKPMIILLSVVVVGASAFFGVIVYLEMQADWKREEEKRSILLVASFDSDRCGAGTPILIRFENIGIKPLLSVRFELRGYRAGFSSPTYGDGIYGALGYESDKILFSGESYESCWTVPKLDGGEQEVPPFLVEWRATYRYGSFQE